MINERDEPLRLTQAEQGIWNGQRLYSNEGLYNTAEWVELIGPLDADRLFDCMDHVYSQADSLNVLIDVDAEGKPGKRQVSQESRCYRTLPISASGVDAAVEFFRADSRRGFDLQRELGYRVYLVRISETRHLWYHCIHHLLSDGYGINLIRQKVLQRYLSVPVTDSLFTPWSAFAKEEESYRASQRYQDDKAFWQASLADRRPPVSYSANSAIPEIDTHCFHKTFSLQLIEQAAQCYDGASWVDFLYASVAAHLACQTGCLEVTLGIPFMGRLGSRSANAAGMVMNIIPLQLNLRGCRCFGDVLKVCIKRLSEVKPHARFRYEEMRALLSAEGFSRLFGPVVNVLPFDQTVRLPDIQSRVHTLSTGPIEDISFLFRRVGDSISIELEANAERYGSDTFERLAASFLHWLEKNIALNAPLQLDSENLSFLSGKELKSGASVVQKITESARRNLRRKALIHEGQSLSYADLLRGMAAAQKRLQKQGIYPGARVILELDRSPQAIIACLACLAQGAAFCFVDPRGPEERKRWIAENLNAECHWTDFSIEELLLEGWELDGPTDLSSGDTTAYVTYTSGSTGRPKGVKISQQSLAEFVTAVNEIYAVSEVDTVLQFAPLQFDACIEEIFVSLCFGACLCLRSADCISSPQMFYEFCQQHRVSILDLPTAYWHEWVNSSVRQATPLPASLRGVIIGGEAANPVVLKSWSEWPATGTVALWNTYGPSEATVVATVAELSGQDEAFIGRPLAGRSVAVMSEEGRISPRGEAGELVLLGSGISQGYVDPQLDQSSFIRFDLPGGRILSGYKTGDLVAMTDDGDLRYLGRRDNEIKISGHRINPSEVEGVMISHPQIEAATVTASVSSSGQKILVAFYTSSTELDDSQLREYLGCYLPNVFIPSLIRWIDHLPITASGKIDRRALLEQVQPLLDRGDEQQNLSSEAQKLVAVWHGVLGPRKIGLEDNFFSLGGTSLQTIQLANQVAEHFSIPFTVADVFTHPTVQGQLDKMNGELVAAHSRAANDDLHKGNWRSRTRLNDVTVQRVFELHGDDIILTGATGYLGIHLLAQLQNQSSRGVVCLVRAASEGRALRRLQAACAEQNLDDQIDWGRVTICLADLTLPQFGLSDSQWANLGKRAYSIVHNAANTSVMQNYKTLRSINSESTEQIIRLAAMSGAQIVHISSVAVIGGYHLKHNQQHNETFVPFHDGLNDGYQKSKWHAEELIRQARDHGFSAVAVRLGRVAPATTNPVVNEKDLIWQVVKSGLEVGVLPDLPIAEPWLSVDITAQAIVQLSIDRLISGAVDTGVVNLVPEQKIQFKQVVQALREEGYQIDVEPAAAWVARILAMGSDEAKPIAWLIQRLFLSGEKSFTMELNNRRGLDLLDRTAFVRNEYALRQCVEDLRSRQIIPTANSTCEVF